MAGQSCCLERAWLRRHYSVFRFLARPQIERIRAALSMNGTSFTDRWRRLTKRSGVRKVICRSIAALCEYVFWQLWAIHWQDPEQR
jgi:DNA relaxase NicK